jgi:hypothetical protein
VIRKRSLIIPLSEGILLSDGVFIIIATSDEGRKLSMSIAVDVWLLVALGLLLLLIGLMIGISLTKARS